ncbi:MAG: DUF177 domain-containing protein [Deltaproteobacteria bacterium]|nr:DUF177 domain-containing protein [Deltaproteobacteria bacterium]
MKIDIYDIPEDGLTLDLTEEGKALEEVAGGKLDFRFASTVAAHLELSKTDGDIFVRGDVKTTLKLSCSRCLKDFDYGFSSTFTDFYSKKREAEKEKELKPEDMEVNYLEGHEIDTNELLLSQISLELPMNPLHDPECKGLCPNCGADLNLGECGCPKGGKTESKFAKLKDFKIK